MSKAGDGSVYSSQCPISFSSRQITVPLSLSFQTVGDGFPVPQEAKRLPHTTRESLGARSQVSLSFRGAKRRGNLSASGFVFLAGLQQK